MRRMDIHSYFILSICSVMLSCNQPKTSSVEMDKQAITEMSKARAKAFNEGNAHEIANHFTGDAVLMAPGKPAMHGLEAVRNYYQAVFDSFRNVLESRYEEIDVSGGMAYGRGFAKVILIRKNSGDSSVSTAKYLNILRKQSDGTWKTTHDIWNGNE